MKLTLRIGAAILVFVAVLAIPSYSGFRSGSLKVQRVELSGADKDNTVAFFDDYALVAPRNPSIEEGNGPLTPDILATLDNNNLYIINTKNPKEEPVRVSLGACHYPTTIVCDGRNAYIRGTAFDEKGEPRDVIACVQLHLEEGKPAVSRTVVVDIPGIKGAETTSDAPTELELAADGTLLATNGVWVLSYKLDEGYLYKVGIFSAEDWGPNSHISFAGFDSKSRTLVVSHNITEQEPDGQLVRRTVLRFFTLEQSGILSSLKIISADQFPKGVTVHPDSRVAITSDDDGNPEAAYFVSSDGYLNQAILRNEPEVGDLFGLVKRLGLIPELAQGEGEPGPRITKLDASGQKVVVLNPGGVLLNIRRPAFAKPGRNIRRPAFVRSLDAPALFIGHLNGKRTKLVQSAIVTGPVLGSSIVGIELQDSEAILTAESGSVISVDIVKGVEDATVDVLGEIGSVDFVTLEQGRIVGISSAQELEDESGKSSGEFVVATRKDDKSSSVALSIARMLSPSAPPLARIFTSIRRPCNLGR